MRTLARTFYERLDKLDELIAAGPAGIDVAQTLLPLFHEYASESYFYGRLTDHRWLQSLRSAGVFDAPPPLADDGQGDHYYPVWPQSLYLVRIAAKVPRQVCTIMLGLSDTENARVREDCAEAAMNMPPRVAADLVPQLVRWLEGAVRLHAADAYGGLVARLAEGVQLEPALHLARALLAIQPDPKAIEKTSDSAHHFSSLEPQTRLDEWAYERVLRDDIPVLARNTGMDCFTMLCDILSTANCLSLRDIESIRSGNDLSVIWRPAVEDHVQNRHKNLKSILVSAVRDTASYLIESGTAKTADLVTQLEERKWSIFERLALHLLCVFGDKSPGDVAEKLTDRSRFYDVLIRHEYTMLLKRRFRQLSRSDRHTILGWIDSGPEGEPPKDANPQIYRDAWRRNKLSFIAESLPRQWAQRYQTLVAELGKAEHAEFPFYMHDMQTGEKSPKEVTELSAMSVSDIVSYLSSWQPSPVPFAPSIEGLARALENAVAVEPDRFASSAEEFTRLSQPMYISHAFMGWRKALEQDRSFDWSRVMGLARWVVSEPHDEPKAEPNENAGLIPRWQWARQSIARLIECALEDREGSIEYGRRQQLWDVLSVLTADADPTPEYEDKQGASNMQQTTLAMNSVRGIAMHAVLLYAIWVRRHLDKLSREAAVHGFGEMPEVRQILEVHLDPSRDPSAAVRSIYGQRFQQLVYLDAEWAKENVSRIFPRYNSQAYLRDAAWESYMLFGQLYGSVYDILEQEYDQAVERIIASSDSNREYGEWEDRLGKHFIVLYWWDRINLQGLKRFFQLAPPRLRGSALQYVGQNLCQTPDDIPLEKLSSLERLWEWRMSEGESLDVETRRAELSSFGWWFTSGKFSESWSLQMLQNVLRHAGWVEPDDDVVKQLAQLSPRIPSIALECLSRLCDGDVRGWSIEYPWGPSIETIVTSALTSGTHEDRLDALDLLNRLGARGFLGFRKLWQKYAQAV